MNGSESDNASLEMDWAGPPEMYRDRTQAGRLLAHAVAPAVEGRCVVAAIPRGGIVVALPVAERLRAPLTLAFVRKITLPGAPELAIGALDEDGHAVMDYEVVGLFRCGPAEVARARERVRAEIERQRHRYDVTPLARIAGDATVVIVDDGLATGLTMRAAVAYARRHGASRVIVAAPCASSEAARVFEREADRFVCPWVDPAFGAVGAYYADFAAVPDDEVVATLERARSWAPA